MSETVVHREPFPRRPCGRRGARRVFLLLAAAAGLLLACGPSDTADQDEAPADQGAAGGPQTGREEGGSDESPAVDMSAAREIFATRCATCHGATGQGDGPGSTALDPKPRNFQDAEWQASVTDEHIANIIQYGGAAVGRSPTMPGNPDLTNRPEVVAGLVRHIRSLSQGG